MLHIEQFILASLRMQCLFSFTFNFFALIVFLPLFSLAIPCAWKDKFTFE